MTAVVKLGLSRSYPALQASAGRAEEGPVRPPKKDPEIRFRRLGSKDFGGTYIYRERHTWWKEAPRIRVRDKQDRINTLWGELAALNERLAGGDAVTARKRIDYLRVRKQQWARTIAAATQYDSAITLALIEQANQKVEEALTSEVRERAPVGVLKKQLVTLQAEVAAAHERLHTTQERLAENLARIKDLQEGRGAGAVAEPEADDMRY